MFETIPALERSLQIRQVFKAPREKVFAAWTQKEQLEQWMCRDVPSQRPRYVELDVRPGGRYVIEILLPDGVLYTGRGIYREVTPPQKLVFTWAWERRPPQSGEPLQTSDSLITVELHDRGALTEMVFTHENFESDAIRYEHEKGWAGCFEKLQEALSA